MHVIVIGAGNAALCAALSAQENGARVTVLERAPEGESGGNSRFTAGIVRFVYDGINDLSTLMPDLSASEIATTDFGDYTDDQFFDDMFRITQYRCDPDLTECLVKKSLETMLWMRSKGVRFMPAYGRQAFKIDGRFKFWGGVAVETVGGGPGLVEYLTRACVKHNINIQYDTRATGLTTDGRAVTGVVIRRGGEKPESVSADAVVLAAGGFQANPEWRTRYLGPGWDVAKVRGTRFNTGEGIRMALDIGAASYGNWSGCHAVAWDRNAPEFGDLSVGDGFQKHSYPLGVMVNAKGKRFLDEGADFRNYTYAMYGGDILRQPGQLAWQIFDAKVSHLLRDEYRIREVTRVTAGTLEDLVQKLDGVDAGVCLEELHNYNAAIREDVEFNPNIKDGRCTEGLALNKSHWANKLDTPPYEAYAVTCGITFTFGGLRINTAAEVLDIDLRPIPGLYAAGELVGGVFYHNYPGGTGLTSGAVFGKIAGASAANAEQLAK